MDLGTRFVGLAVAFQHCAKQFRQGAITLDEAQVVLEHRILQADLPNDVERRLITDAPHWLRQEASNGSPT